MVPYGMLTPGLSSTPSATTTTPLLPSSVGTPTWTATLMTTFSATMAWSTTAPALMTVLGIITESFTMAPFSTVTEWKSTECSTSP